MLKIYGAPAPTVKPNTALLCPLSPRLIPSSHCLSLSNPVVLTPYVCTCLDSWYLVSLQIASTSFQFQVSPAHANLNRRGRPALVIHGMILRFSIRIIGYNILALGKGFPHAAPEGALLICMIRVAQERHDGFCGFFGIVLGYATNEKISHTLRDGCVGVMRKYDE